MERLIDLHTHSIKSDGSLPPREVIRCAKESGLSAVALSDHDTIDGVREAMDEGEKLGIEVVPAIELSAKSKAAVHILGYYIDLDSKFLNQELATARYVREQRNKQTAKNLQAVGFDVTMEEALALAPGGLVGRAHFAKVMVQKGYAESVKDAFRRFLDPGKPGYCTAQLFSPEDAVHLIKRSGGKAFLAHLHQTKLEGEELFKFVSHLKDQGLDGIEGYYTEYTPKMNEEYRGIAKKLDLCLSGGTDFHAEMKPHIKIGRGLGDLKIPYSVLENIKNLK